MIQGLRHFVVALVVLAQVALGGVRVSGRCFCIGDVLPARVAATDGRDECCCDVAPAAPGDSCPGESENGRRDWCCVDSLDPAMPAECPCLTVGSQLSVTATIASSPCLAIEPRRPFSSRVPEWSPREAPELRALASVRMVI